VAFEVRDLQAAVDGLAADGLAGTVLTGTTEDLMR
jgi:hypothetical protein